MSIVFFCKKLSKIYIFEWLMEQSYKIGSKIFVIFTNEKEWDW